MPRFFYDEGIVLKKRSLLKEDKLITIFSQKRGKIELFAKGVKKITSKRLPHLELGNIIKFNYYKKGDIFYLRETEVILPFSIKKSLERVNFLYRLLFILNKILPENQREFEVYQKTITFLKKSVSDNSLNCLALENFLKETLFLLGFLPKEVQKNKSVNTFSVIEELINEKIVSPLS